MKKYLSAMLAIVIAVSTFAYANGDSTVFTVGSSVSEGTVTVEVSYVNNIMVRAGSFNIIYDNSKMSLIEVATGSALDNSLVAINEKMAENKIRIAWASVGAMPKEGVVLKAILKLNSAEFKKSDIGFEKLEVSNANGVAIKDVTMKLEGIETIPNVETEGDMDKGESTDGEIVEDNNSNIIDDEIIYPENGESFLPTGSQESSEDKAQRFVDVKDVDWFFDSVNYVSENKLMSGVGVDMFAPNEKLTRAMMVVVLHRLEGTPKGENSGFSDIEADSWYESAVNWAASSGIVNGVGEGRFEPHTNITREQIATILYNYSQSKDMVMAGATAILTPDSHKISDWALEAMGWVVGEELIQGKEDGLLDPQCEATRAEFATILMRYIEKIK